MEPGSIELMGTAGEVGAMPRRMAVPPMAAKATSLTVPHVPQSGQRPTHLGVWWWHSEQRYCERVFEVRATDVTVSAGTDKWAPLRARVVG